MNFKKIKAVTLIELIIYIALSVILSLVLLQITNLILSKKKINDTIKENVESIEAKKASALLSQYVKKPISAIPPFVSLPPSPPYEPILPPGVSVPIYNPWDTISANTNPIPDYEEDKDCSCKICTIAYYMKSPTRNDTIGDDTRRGEKLKSTFKTPVSGGAKIAWTDCPDSYFEKNGIYETFDERAQDILDGALTIEAPQEAIEYLEEEKIIRECYERKIREKKDVVECDYIDAIKERVKKTQNTDFLHKECQECFFANIIWIPVGGTGSRPGDGKGTLSSIDSFSRFSWSSNVGWIDFSEVRVDTENFDLIGQATVITNNSKLSLNCESTNTCKNSDYKVSISEQGVLHGYAWGGDSLGWISFNCNEGSQDGESICDSSLYGVYIEPQTAKLNGHAWSENIGWISFDCSTGGVDMGSICNTSDYGVQMSYLKEGHIGVDFDEGSYTIPLEGYNKFGIDSISNSTATNDGSFTLTSISGSNFMDNALVYLYNKDYGNIYSTNTPTFNSNESISNIQFNLKGKPTGDYSVVFVNPNGDYGILNNGINVTSN